MDETRDEAAEVAGDALAEGLIEVEMAAGFSRDDRAMIRTLGPLIESTLGNREKASDRVAFALDRMLIAACERVARICGSDVPDVQDCEDA